MAVIEARAARLSVPIYRALRLSGVPPQTWWRWKKGLSSPTFANFEEMTGRLTRYLDGCEQEASA